jgi:hypothetical protein
MLIPVGRATDLKKWEWNDANTEERFCQFGDSYYDLEEAFQGAGLDPHPVSQGGHNQCFHTEHWDHDKDGGPNRDTQYYDMRSTGRAIAYVQCSLLEYHIPISS